MKVVKNVDLKFIPASHEDPQNPGVFKKVLVGKNDLIKGQIMMINWAKLPVGKSFATHYHEDMEEVFIILNGKTKVKVGEKEAELERGDAVITPIKTVHEMANISTEDVYYIALGISKGEGGRSVNV
jgi:mannose-6-phosphate isomerase-like protein (cupin superfamily)